MTPGEAINANPQLETVKIKYRPGGGDENSVVVNGAELSEIVSCFSVHLNDPHSIPVVKLGIGALAVAIEIDAVVKVDSTTVTDEFARKMYEDLKLRFGAL